MGEFYVIFAVPRHIHDWKVISILSRWSDAEEFFKTASKSESYLAVSDPQLIDMQEILDLLVKDRLMILHDAVMRVVSGDPDRINRLLESDQRLAARKTILDPEGEMK